MEVNDFQIYMRFIRNTFYFIYATKDEYKLIGKQLL